MLSALIPAPYQLLAKIMAATALITGLWLAVDHHNASQQAIGYARAAGEYRVAKTLADQAALDKERLLKKTVEDAQNAAIERETKLRADYAAAHAAALSLRGTIADLRGRLATAPVAACRQTADTALVVFGECTDEYRALAEAADGHASDVETLTQAWPR